MATDRRTAERSRTRERHPSGERARRARPAGPNRSARPSSGSSGRARGPAAGAGARGGTAAGRGAASAAGAASATSAARAGIRGGRLAAIRTRTALAALVGVLCVIGLIMVGSASPLISLQLYGSAWTLFSRQAMWMVGGLVAMALAARIDYRVWRKGRGLLVGGTLLLLVAVLVPGLGVTSGGSSRWIGIGPLGIQPSELMKFAVAVFVADLLTRRVDRLADARAVLVPTVAVVGVAVVLILKQPDMGTALVLCCITLGILFMAGVRMAPILKVTAAAVVLALIVGLAEPYRRDRILSFLNPGANRSGSGYQVWQSLIGLGSGHLFGMGLGGGHAKWLVLPNAQTDFIFSVVGEELGLVGAVVVLLLFFALAAYGLRAAVRAPDRFGSLLAVGVTVWITSQAVINVGAVVGLLPVTGIPLPFISFGGTSLVITLAAVGVLLNIAGQERTRGARGRSRLRPART